MKKQTKVKPFKPFGNKVKSRKSLPKSKNDELDAIFLRVIKATQRD
jgi:hypothetical protein